MILLRKMFKNNQFFLNNHYKATQQKRIIRIPYNIILHTAVSVTCHKSSYWPDYLHRRITSDRIQSNTISTFAGKKRRTSLIWAILYDDWHFVSIVQMNDGMVTLYQRRVDCTVGRSEIPSKPSPIDRNTREKSFQFKRTSLLGIKSKHYCWDLDRPLPTPGYKKHSVSWPQMDTSSGIWWIHVWKTWSGW